VRASDDVSVRSRPVLEDDVVTTRLLSSNETRRATLIGVAVGVPASLVFLWLAFRNTDTGAVWAAARGADLG